MTYQNLGYWIGQANDLSTGSHPVGWTSGQRWSETASEWMSMYNAMLADRNAWQSNANTAYDSGTWGVGTHWHSRWTTTNNDLTNMTADRNYWKTTVAHDDPDVWTNRYNAGYAASTAAIAPLTRLVVGLGNLALTGTFQQVGTVTLTRTGPWHISWVNSLGDGGDISHWAYAELQNASAGGTVLSASMGRMRYAGVNVTIGGQTTGIFNSGTVIRLYARVSGSGNWSIDGNGQLIASFSPTPQYQA